MSYLPSNVGSTTLVGGEKEVADSKIATTSKVFLSNIGTGGTIGTLSAKIYGGSSFVINSSNILDTSTIDYLVIY